jgi:hypothetical protein
MTDFALPDRFKTIIIARNTILQLLETDRIRACLSRVLEHLAPGGEFVFDIYNPDVRILAAAPNERRLVRKFVHPLHGEVSLELVSVYDSATQVNRGTWHHSTANAPDFLVSPINLLCIFPEELRVLLESVGFRLKDRWGDFERNTFSSQSRFQVCVATGG